MKLSSRELILACATGVILILGVSFLAGAPLVRTWRDARTQRTRLASQKAVAERLVAMRPQWESRYREMRERIPVHGPTAPVTAEMLKMIKRLADENQVSLSRIEPDKEKNIGDLYEVAIDCTWDGTLEAVVRFLYAVQTQGAILDIRQMTVGPAQGAPGRLKGNFTVFVAFSRSAATPQGAPAAAPEAPTSG